MRKNMNIFLKRMKVRQHVSNLLNKDTSDNLTNSKIIYNNTHIEQDVIKYFSGEIAGFVYPAKSYIVATCYACWIKQLAQKENITIDIRELLNDKSFLYLNDPYFVIYKSNKHLYDFIFDYIEKNNIGFNSKIVNEIFNYFIKEYQILNHERTYLANNALLSMQS